MVQKKILLLVIAVTLVTMSCVAVALVTNYFINREEAPAKSPDVAPVIPPAVKTSEVIVTGQASQPEPQLQPPALIEESANKAPARTDTVTAPGENIAPPADEAGINADQEQKISPEEKNVPPAASQTQAPLPPFTPITNNTGPVMQPKSDTQNPPAPSTDISSFVPPPNTTGPVVQDNAEHKNLPAFTPTTSQTGPVKTTEE